MLMMRHEGQEKVKEESRERGKKERESQRLKPSHGQTVREANEPKSEGGKKLRKKTKRPKVRNGEGERRER